MPEREAARYTIGVFKDAASAEAGVAALTRHGFPTEALTIAGKESDEVAALAKKVFGREAGRWEYPELGGVIGAGSLVEDLAGGRPAAPSTGLAVALRRIGFQPHDGRIYEALVARGGVLVAVRGESRAADALATLHNYGGGNAAIGAWLGRL
jgi:hypothetical protein